MIHFVGIQQLYFHTLLAEYESKVAEYQQNESTYSDIVKEDKIREVESIQQRILEFQKSAQQSLSEKEIELFTPIRDKATNAIHEWR